MDWDLLNQQIPWMAMGVIVFLLSLYDWIGYVPCFRTHALCICSTKMVIASIWIWVLRTSTDIHADQVQWQLATANP